VFFLAVAGEGMTEEIIVSSVEPIIESSPDIVSQAVTIVQSSNEGLQALLQYVVSLPSIFIQLLSLDWRIVVLIAVLTWFLNHFIVSTTIGTYLPAWATIVLTLIIVLSSISVWLAFIYPVIKGIGG
jgi:hypothetical protein